ncbi:RDD family protein [Flavobacterium humi]|uniref:RDD family protein n=1 Tax=Flavobacterium humi TaxID=2562683 RepID=A0A4Z0L7X0_9FLAO|nr:RDD family protein [Flavobacterium humi]TGD57690.1 RDD family protein [Flavobacterium humi]
MENTAPFEITDEMLASRGQRFVNYTIDIIIQYILYFILIIIVFIVNALLGSTSMPDQWFSGFQGTFFFLVFMTFYYTLFESYFSRSIAKYITKTMVVMEDGSKPDSSIILRRSLCRIIPFEAFSFLGYDARGWHDSLSCTYVVKKEAFERSRALFDSFEEIGKEQIFEH